MIIQTIKKKGRVIGKVKEDDKIFKVDFGGTYLWIRTEDFSKHQKNPKSGDRFEFEFTTFLSAIRNTK